jgi:hypothetical protein
MSPLCTLMYIHAAYKHSVNIQNALTLEEMQSADWNCLVLYNDLKN